MSIQVPQDSQFLLKGLLDKFDMKYDKPIKTTIQTDAYLDLYEECEA